jgi:hypothetical protein
VVAGGCKFGVITPFRPELRSRPADCARIRTARLNNSLRRRNSWVSKQTIGERWRPLIWIS